MTERTIYRCACEENMCVVLHNREGMAGPPSTCLLGFDKHNSEGRTWTESDSSEIKNVYSRFYVSSKKCGTTYCVAMIAKPGGDPGCPWRGGSCELSKTTAEDALERLEE